MQSEATQYTEWAKVHHVKSDRLAKILSPLGEKWETGLLDEVVKYAKGRGFVPPADFDPLNMHFTLLKTFTCDLVKQGVDPELLDLLNHLFVFSEEHFGNYEWHLLKDDKHPSGYKLEQMSGYDAVHSPEICRIIRPEQLLDDSKHLKDYNAGAYDGLSHFLTRAQSVKHLKMFADNVKRIPGRLVYVGTLETVEEIRVDLLSAIKEIDTYTFERLAKIWEVGLLVLTDFIGDPYNSGGISD